MASGKNNKNKIKKNSKLAAKLLSLITVMMLILTAALSAFFVFVDFDALNLRQIQRIIWPIAFLILISAVFALITNHLINVFVVKPLDKLLKSFRSGEGVEDVHVDSEMEGLKDVYIEQREEIKHNEETIREVKTERDTDDITALLNRPAFIEKTGELIKKSKNGQYAIICIDIDHFGEINTRYGFEVGDMVLRRMATHIRLEQDKDEWYACHDRADVFYMIKPVDKAETGKIASLDVLFDRTLPVDDIQYHVGAAVVEDTEMDIVFYMDCARAAMKESKADFGRKLKWYDKTTKEKKDREKLISDSAETAISENQFIPCFQPKYDYESGKMIGAEALVRWNHPVLGIISPAEFIPLFERNGFIMVLGKYMLESVCQKIADWKKSGFNTVPVSMNLSRREVTVKDLAETIHKTVMSYGLAPNEIRFEVTEQSYSDSPEKLKKLVNDLHGYGYKVELDNYGSGYMSAKTLIELPVDMLKLDGSVVTSLAKNEKREAITSMLIRTAKLMGVPGLVAQGVESDDVAQSLKEMGCTMMQGYLFAKPMFPEEFEKLLADKK